MKTCVAIRHLPFESLDAWEAPLAERFALDYVDAPVDGVDDSIDPDLLVVLGAPLGANDGEAYPFLEDEIRLLRRRLQAQRPTLGICLGAQLMARALDATVTAGDIAEIGWIPLTLSPAGIASPLKHFDGQPVFHWHSDQLQLPDGAQLLASTPDCPHQAFAIGSNILGLQFHPEVSAGQLQAWYVGHHRSLVASGLDVHRLRRDAERHSASLQQAGQACLAEWLDGLDY